MKLETCKKELHEVCSKSLEVVLLEDILKLIYHYLITEYKALKNFKNDLIIMP